MRANENDTTFVIAILSQTNTTHCDSLIIVMSYYRHVSTVRFYTVSV